MSSTTVSSQGSPFSRSIVSNRIDTFTPFNWLRLAVDDLIKAPLLILLYGLVFSLIPASILYFTISVESNLVILPAIVAFFLFGPIFAVGLYEVASQLEKGSRLTLDQSLKSMFKNSAGEWRFAIALTPGMMVWTDIVAVIKTKSSRHYE